MTPFQYLQWAAGLTTMLAVLALAGKTRYLETGDRNERWTTVLTGYVLGFLIILTAAL